MQEAEFQHWDFGLVKQRALLIDTGSEYGSVVVAAPK